MKKKFKKNKAVIGMVLICVSIALIAYWEIAGRKTFMYQEVFVLENALEEGELVSDGEQFKIQRVDMNADIENLVTDLNDVMDKEAVSYIPANTPLVYDYFKESNLVLNNDEYVFRIPDKWIISYPSSLRRGDTAYLYPLDNSNSSELDYNFDVQNIEPIQVRIAFVKDSTNKEVRTVGDERLDATSNISSLEIATNVENFNKINKYVNEGKAFVIYYK